MPNNGIIIEKLNRNHLLLDFDCGDEEINNYFNEKSFNDVETKNAQVYVALTGNKNKIIGFFTLSMKAVRIEIEGEKKAWPVTLLGQLGVNKDFQGEGWGKYLVTNAIEMANKISESIGCIGVIVETYKELSSFYEKLGFKYVKTDKVKGRKRITYFYKFNRS